MDRRGPTGIPPAQIAQIRRLRRTTANSFEAIAQAIGCAASTVQYYCIRRAGVEYTELPPPWPLQGWEVRAKEITK